MCLVAALQSIEGPVEGSVCLRPLHHISSLCEDGAERIKKSLLFDSEAPTPKHDIQH